MSPISWSSIVAAILVEQLRDAGALGRVELLPPVVDLLQRDLAPVDLGDDLVGAGRGLAPGAAARGVWRSATEQDGRQPERRGARRWKSHRTSLTSFLSLSSDRPDAAPSGGGS